MTIDANAVLDQLSTSLIPLGFDIARPFSVQWYNSKVESDKGLELETFGRTNTFGILIGNTKNLWEPFINWLKSNPSFLYSSQPLHSFVDRSLKNALKTIMPPELKYTLRFAHETTPGRLVAMQLLAHEAGLAYYCRPIGLCISSTYGAWFALRACITIDLDGPKDELYREPSHPCPEVQEDLLKALEDAKTPPLSWMKWLALRDLIPIAKDTYRYSDKQIAYHYTANRQILLSTCMPRNFSLPRTLFIDQTVPSTFTE